MAQQSMITEEIKRLLGKETVSVVYHVDLQWIKRFSEAIDDSNPLWQDEKFARKTHYGGVIAPPTFPCCLHNDVLRKQLQEMDHPLKRLVNRSSELEFFQPIKAGDVISVTDKLVDATEQEGKTGKTVIFRNEVTYRNQLGEIVAISRDSAMRY